MPATWSRLFSSMSERQRITCSCRPHHPRTETTRSAVCTATVCGRISGSGLESLKSGSSLSGPFTSGIFGHHGLIMRGILYNVFVPVAIDPETGDILRDSNTGFALRAPYEQGVRLSSMFLVKRLSRGTGAMTRRPIRNSCATPSRRGSLLSIWRCSASAE